MVRQIKPLGYVQKNIVVWVKMSQWLNKSTEKYVDSGFPMGTELPPAGQ